MARQDPQYAAWGWTPHKFSAKLVSLEVLGRKPCRFDPRIVDAVKALESALIVTGYENPCDFIGTWNYRVVGGTDQLSRHAYALAIDVDYGGDNPASPWHPGIDRNPHLKRPIVASDWGKTIQILEHQVRAVESIRTNSGVQVWRWLGWSIGDSMHFDINCSPEDIASGIREEDGMPYEQFKNMVISLFKGRPDMFKGDPSYFYKNLPDGIYNDPQNIDWTNFWRSFTDAISKK